MSYLDGDGLYGKDKNTPAFFPNGRLATADGVAIAAGNLDELVTAESWTVATPLVATYNNRGPYALTPGIYDVYICVTMTGAAGVTGQMVGFSTDSGAASCTDLVYAGNANISYNQTGATNWSDMFVIKSLLVTANTNYYVKFNPQGANGVNLVGNIRIVKRS